MFGSSAAKAQVTRELNPSSPPLWELGVGAGSVRFPDYPGSKETQSLTLPLPLFIYRGSILRSDQENGFRGRFFEDERLELSLSFGGSLPAPSSQNQARQGMANLNPVAEIGPNLRFKVKEFSPSSPFRISLNLPIRIASSVDFPHLSEQGYIFNPSLFFLHQGFLSQNLILFLGVNVRFATEKHHEYFFSVEPEYANADRSQYKAKGGYTSAGGSIALSYLFPNNFSIFSAMAVTNYSGSVIRASPLLTANQTVTVVMGFTWWFYESTQRASP